MIIKYFNLKKSLEDQNNFYLLYGKNTGLIEDTINEVLKPIFSKNIFYYDELEILSNLEAFKEKIYNNSFFENDKLIIISRGSDKLLSIIEELTEKKLEDIKIIIKSEILEKKSKLRNFFEKSNEKIIVPFYEDNDQTLMVLAQNFFKKKKIRISPENINFIVRKTMGNRINLRNELEKIANYSQKKLTIGSEEILKLTNLAENYNFSELADCCLAKNKRKTINILNENNTSNEDNILIIKTFLYKLKRLRKLKKELEMKKNPDIVITSFKPPIFWKDRDVVKQQLKIWSLNQIQSLIQKINDLELLVKKNSQISSQLVNDFILEKLDSSNS
ncbi:DNA polymerase III subunit delta [Candidatus Pelagibacter sp.]|nr:DNA polymerase III subunit delta [Candidatus Pelagibacter sp.]